MENICSAETVSCSLQLRAICHSATRYRRRIRNALHRLPDILYLWASVGVAC